MPSGYVVPDANEQALAHICSPDNEAEARQAKMLTKGGARWIAICSGMRIAIEPSTGSATKVRARKAEW